MRMLGNALASPSPELSEESASKADWTDSGDVMSHA